MSQEVVLEKIHQLILLKGRQNSLDKNEELNNSVIESLRNAYENLALTDSDYTKIIDKYPMTKISETNGREKLPQVATYYFCGVKILTEKKYHATHYRVCDDLMHFDRNQLEKLIKEKYVPDQKSLEEKKDELTLLQLSKETLKLEEKHLTITLDNLSSFRFLKKKKLQVELESKRMKLLGVAKQIDTLQKEISSIENKTNKEVLEEALSLQDNVKKIYDMQNSKDNLEKEIQRLNKENEEIKSSKKEVVMKSGKILVEILSNKEHMKTLEKLANSLPEKSLDKKMIDEILAKRHKSNQIANSSSRK